MNKQKSYMSAFGDNQSGLGVDDDDLSDDFDKGSDDSLHTQIKRLTEKKKKG